MVDSGQQRSGPEERRSKLGERRARKVIVPELAGMHLDDARIVVAQAGFAGADGLPRLQVRYVEAYAQEFHVVGQSPARGLLVESSAQLELQVARQGWGRFLPQLYSLGDADNAFLQQFLRIFQQIHDSTGMALARLPTLLRPLETEPQFLPWLASWLALQLETDWNDKQKRQWLRLAPSLYHARGTRHALQTLLGMHLGFLPQIRENAWPFEPFRVGVSSEIGVSSTILPPLDLAHCFVVHLPVADNHFSAEQIVRIHRVIQAEKPAHTLYYLTFASDDAATEDAPFLTIGDALDDGVGGPPLAVET